MQVSVDAINEVPPSIEPFPIEKFRAGMGCRTAKGHMVRIDQIHMDTETPYAHVHFIKTPHTDGDMFLHELTPVAVSVQIGDEVMLHAGDEGRMIRGQVESIDGDYASFLLEGYNEIHRAHTSHVMSIRPRRTSRQGVKHG